MPLEGRQHIVVHEMHDGDRQLAGVEPGPGIAREAVDGGLQVDFADALHGADEEGIDGNQVTRMAGLDVTLSELRTEALQEADLLVRELDLALGRSLLQAQQTFGLGQQAVAAPDPAHAAGGDLDALEHQLLGNAQGTVARMVEAVIQDRLLDFGRHPVGMRPPGAGQAIDQPLGAIGLIVIPASAE